VFINAEFGSVGATAAMKLMYWLIVLKRGGQYLAGALLSKRIKKLSLSMGKLKHRNIKHGLQ